MSNTTSVYIQAKDDYHRAAELKLTQKNRWEEGIEHHPMSERAVRFIAIHDFKDYNDYFGWNVGAMVITVRL